MEHPGSLYLKESAQRGSVVAASQPVYTQRAVRRADKAFVTTMWRTYAAWMEGAPETDIALVQAAMNRDAPAIERMSNAEIELTLSAPAVAGLATRRAAPKAQVPDKNGQKEWRRGWDSNEHVQAIGINNLRVLQGHPIPSTPPRPPFLPVDSASTLHWS